MRRRCSASSPRISSALSRKMSIQIRGFAPAMRVMSRSEPPACVSGSCPSTREAPVWLATMFASTCGTWLVSATSRSCAAASIATGVAPTSVMNPCTSRCRSGSVWATGVRNQVAPSKRPALAFSAPRVSEPQIGCPPTKRAEPAAAATTLDLVEPTSVTVASPGAASTAATVAGRCAIGEATTTSSASATASSRPSAPSPPRVQRRRRAPRDRGPSPPRRRRARARRARRTRPSTPFR